MISKVLPFLLFLLYIFSLILRIFIFRVTSKGQRDNSDDIGNLVETYHNTLQLGIVSLLVVSISTIVYDFVPVGIENIDNLFFLISVILILTTGSLVFYYLKIGRIYRYYHEIVFYESLLLLIWIVSINYINEFSLLIYIFIAPFIMSLINIFGFYFLVDKLWRQGLDDSETSTRNKNKMREKSLRENILDIDKTDIKFYRIYFSKLDRIDKEINLDSSGRKNILKFGFYFFVFLTPCIIVFFILIRFI